MLFPQMVSGMYLGEVTRNVLLHLVDSQVLFDGYSSKALNAHYGLDTASELSSSPFPPFVFCKNLFPLSFRR
jgi:hexokinase